MSPSALLVCVVNNDFTTPSRALSFVSCRFSVFFFEKWCFFKSFKNCLHFYVNSLFERGFNLHFIYFYSYPLKEPGGYHLSFGGSRYALPGPNQAARARLRTGGGGQGKVSHQFPYICVPP